MTDEYMFARESAQDSALLDELREMWQECDPPPAHLAETVLVALATADLDDEYARLTLVSATRELAGARGPVAEATAPLRLEFAGRDVSVLLQVSELEHGCRRIDGWVVPGEGVSVTIWQERASRTLSTSAHGRFECADLSEGLTRLWLTQPSDDPASPETVFSTTLFEI